MTYELLLNMRKAVLVSTSRNRISSLGFTCQKKKEARIEEKKKKLFGSHSFMLFLSYSFGFYLSSKVSILGVFLCYFITKSNYIVILTY